MISVNNLSYFYNETFHDNSNLVLDQLTLEVPTGGFCSILGPSGCGKSTVLQCVSGLLPTKNNTVLLNDLHPEIIQKKHEIGFVFQKPIFFEWKNILLNLTLPITIAGKSDAIERAKHFLALFQLEETAELYPHELSGGMLARAALARALVTEPTFLLLDEAFNYLDEALRGKLNLDIQTYWMDRKPTILAVTHSISEAILMSDEIIILSSQPAHIIRKFDVKFDRPRSLSLLSTPSALELEQEIRATLQSTYTDC